MQSESTSPAGRCEDLCNTGRKRSIHFACQFGALMWVQWCKKSARILTSSGICTFFRSSKFHFKGSKWASKVVRYTRGHLPLHPPIRRIFSFNSNNNPLCNNSKISPLWTVLFRLAGNCFKNVVISLRYLANQKGGVKGRLSRELQIACENQLISF